MTRRAARLTAVGFAVTALLVTGCSDASPGEDIYSPVELEEIADSDVKKVVLTQDAARRIGLKSVPAQDDGEQVTVPYAALIYDGEGDIWVYAASEDLTFVRVEIDVERIDGDVVWLSEGLTPGTQVVTVGAAEIYGAEMEISGKH